MAGLFFVNGVMGSGKTRALIGTYHDYNDQGLSAIIIKPLIDTKGDNKIVSRDNTEQQVNYLISEESNIYTIILERLLNQNKLDCILVDEAQFLTEEHVKQLYAIADELDVRVICYGLIADFQDKLFPGSAALLARSPINKNLEKICTCGNIATCNVRFIGDTPTDQGAQVVIDDSKEVSYKALCRKCRKQAFDKSISIT